MADVRFTVKDPEGRIAYKFLLEDKEREVCDYILRIHEIWGKKLERAGDRRLRIQLTWSCK